MTPEQRETLTAMLQASEVAAANWRKHVHEASWAEGQAVECESRADALRAALSCPAPPDDLAVTLLGRLRHCGQLSGYWTSEIDDALSAFAAPAPVAAPAENFPVADMARACACCGHIADVHRNGGVGACGVCECQTFMVPVAAPAPETPAPCSVCGRPCEHGYCCTTKAETPEAWWHAETPAESVSVPEARLRELYGGTPPAPETPAPVDVPACSDGQHSYRRNAPPQNGDVCFVCRKSIWWETPAPDAAGNLDLRALADSISDTANPSVRTPAPDAMPEKCWPDANNAVRWKPDDVVGHTTARDADGSLRHEPLTREVADALWKTAEEARLRRVASMPDERAAIAVLFSAWLRLKELGWKEAEYCPKDGTPFDAIEPGSTGVHRCHYDGKWPDGRWWTSDEHDMYPSRPILWRRQEAQP